MKRNLSIIVILSIILICLILKIIQMANYLHISAKFKELRPMEENIPVYYKGIIIGKARERRHTGDFQHTIIRLVLYPKNLLLPENTTVLLKCAKRNDKEWDFLELVYPKEPSKKMLSNGSVIEGIATVDVESFMKNQKADDLEEIKQNLAQAAENLNYALGGLNQVFETVNDTIKQNQKNLYSTTSNFSNMSGKINNSTNQKQLSNTLSSVEQSTINTSTLTKNIDDLSADLSSSTPQTMANIEGITSNINSITCGIRKTLNKKFGTLRLFFGQILNECE